MLKNNELKPGEDLATSIFKIVVFCGTLIGGVLVSLLFTIWRAWWLLPGCGWFVSDPAPGFWKFVGMLVLLGGIMARYRTRKLVPGTDYKMTLVISTIGPPLVWLGMWFVHTYGVL